MSALYVLAVFLGLGLGGVFRWLLAVCFNGQYPLGTILANVLGCFLLGFLTRMTPASDCLRLLFMTGFCGGFTTFSTFMNESLFIMRGGQMMLALLYIVTSLVFGLAAAWFGYQITLR